MARKNKAAFAVSAFSASPAISNVEGNAFTAVFRVKKVEGPSSQSTDLPNKVVFLASTSCLSVLLAGFPSLLPSPSSLCSLHERPINPRDKGLRQGI